MPGAAPGCLTVSPSGAVADGWSEAGVAEVWLCDLLGRDDGAFWGQRCKTGQVLHVSALTAVL